MLIRAYAYEGSEPRLSCRKLAQGSCVSPLEVAGRLVGDARSRPRGTVPSAPQPRFPRKTTSAWGSWATEVPAMDALWISNPRKAWATAAWLTSEIVHVAPACGSGFGYAHPRACGGQPTHRKSWCL